MRFVLKLDAFAAISGTKFQKLSGLFPRTPLGFAWPSCPPPPKKKTFCPATLLDWQLHVQAGNQTKHTAQYKVSLRWASGVSSWIEQLICNGENYVCHRFILQDIVTSVVFHWQVYTVYSWLPITRTFRGNIKRFESSTQGWNHIENDLKGNENYFKLVGGSSLWGFKLPVVNCI